MLQCIRFYRLKREDITELLNFISAVVRPPDSEWKKTAMIEVCSIKPFVYNRSSNAIWRVYKPKFANFRLTSLLLLLLLLLLLICNTCRSTCHYELAC